jgi:putative methionine-R-sulfoxide reductase with GAF domain/predicted phosphodiesterase
MTTPSVPPSPTRVAALYDVHGNVAALDAVLAEALALQPDLVVFGGDALPGPFPKAVFDRIRELEVPLILLRGNGERELLAAPEDDPLLSQLDEAARSHVAAWIDSATLDLPGLGRTVFCHAAPGDDEQIVTPATPDDVLRQVYGGLGANLVVLGHTHIQMDRPVGDDLRIVNPGSVGWPYAAQPGAYWALLADGRVYLRRTTYDLDVAAADIALRSTWPIAAEFAAENVTQVPTAEDATAAFEAQREARSAGRTLRAELDTLVVDGHGDGLSLSERAHRVADALRAAGDYRWVGLYAVGPDRISVIAHTGDQPPTYPSFPRTQGLNGAAVRARASVVSNDVARDTRYLVAYASTGSELIVPVLGRDGEVVGTIDVESERTDAFGERDQALLEGCAAALAPLFSDGWT